jgi:hypothetical protein
MYFDDDKDDRDPSALFGDAQEPPDDAIEETAEELTQDINAAEPATIEPTAPPQRVSGGFSWAGFAGALAAFVWIGGAIGGPLSYFGVDAVLAMDPAMQAGMIALAFGPALLFWLASSAAGEALKARRIASHLVNQGVAAFPVEAGEANVQRLTNTVKGEIEALNDAVAGAMNRLAELETFAQRNVVLFDTAIAASRDSTELMATALRHEHDALVELNGDMKGQTETLAHSIGRQVRLMREASKLVKTEISAAEDALEGHMGAFNASASVLSERTVAIQQAADTATAATSALNGSMTGVLEGLVEATRLTETAKKSTEQAVMAANETAGAVRETTRSAVFEAKRAAQLIRAEAAAMQDAATDTLARLQDAANAARMASEESQAAADRHAASLEKRLTALAATAGAKKAPLAPKREERVEAPVERVVVRPVVVEEPVSLHAAAASAAVARGGSRPQVRAAAPDPVVQTAPKRIFKGFSGWANLMPQLQREDEMPQAANEDADDEAFDLVDFSARQPQTPDAMLQADAIELATEAGVDLCDVLNAADLDSVARASRQGSDARRQAVADAAPVAVNRIARHVKRHSGARAVAQAYRARPDLAKSDKKAQGQELVRAYLLIDAALS